MLKQEMLFTYIRQKVWGKHCIFFYGNESGQTLKTCSRQKKNDADPELERPKPL
jgi:hypothetical protein